jgi:hypothetical protein
MFERTNKWIGNGSKMDFSLYFLDFFLYRKIMYVQRGFDSLIN